MKNGFRFDGSFHPRDKRNIIKGMRIASKVLSPSKSVRRKRSYMQPVSVVSSSDKFIGLLLVVLLLVFVFGLLWGSAGIAGFLLLVVFLWSFSFIKNKRLIQKENQIEQLRHKYDQVTPVESNGSISHFLERKIIVEQILALGGALVWQQALDICNTAISEIEYAKLTIEQLNDALKDYSVAMNNEATSAAERQIFAVNVKECFLKYTTLADPKNSSGIKPVIDLSFRVGVEDLLRQHNLHS